MAFDLLPQNTKRISIDWILEHLDHLGTSEAADLGDLGLGYDDDGEPWRARHLHRFSSEMAGPDPSLPVTDEMLLQRAPHAWWNEYREDVIGWWNDGLTTHTIAVRLRKPAEAAGILWDRFWSDRVGGQLRRWRSEGYAVTRRWSRPDLRRQDR